MANYVYDLSKSSDVRKLVQFFDDFSKIIDSKEFKNYVADKLLTKLYSLNNKLGSFGAGEEHDVFLSKVEEYKNNHKKEIGNDYILIFNDTTLTQDEMYWVSDKTKQNYPEGLSISYLIEYGSGLLGTEQDDWQVNAKGTSKSWSYKKDDKVYHTSGISGRFVYQELLEYVKNNMQQWIDEFLEREWEKD